MSIDLLNIEKYPFGNLEIKYYFSVTSVFSVVIFF